MPASFLSKLSSVLGYRPMVWAAGCVITGILAAHAAQADRWGQTACAVLGSLAAMACLAAIGCAWRAGRRGLPSEPTGSVSPDSLKPLAQGWRSPLFLLFLGLSLFLGGAWREAVNETQLAEGRTMFPSLPFRSEVAARLTEPPEHALADDADGYWQAAGVILELNGSPLAEPVPALVSGAGVRPETRGVLVRGLISVRRDDAPGWPGAFDLAEYLRQNGLSGSVRLMKGYTLEDADTSGWLVTSDRLRKTLVTHLLAALPDQRGAFLAAVLAGYRKHLSDEMRDRFQQTGVGHILSISGLHVAMITSIVWFAFGLFVRDRRILAAISIAACLGYVVLSGASVAAVRSGVMATVYLAGFLVSRRSDLTNSLGAAALGLAFLNPAVIFNMGFLLSFIAVLFIERGAALSLGPLEQLSARGWRRTRWFAALLVTCVVAWLGVLPLSLYAFGQAAPAGLLVNLLAMPWTTLVLAAGIGVQAAALLSAPGWLIGILAWPTTALLEALRWAEAIPDWVMAPPGKLWVLLYYGGFALLFLRLGVGRSVRVSRLVSAGACLLAAAGLAGIVWGGSSPCAGGQTVALLPGRLVDTLVWTRPDGKSVVIGDGAWAWKDACRYLRQNGVGQLPAIHVKLEWPRPSSASSKEETGAAESVAENAVRRIRLDWNLAKPSSPKTFDLDGATLTAEWGRDGKLAWLRFETLEPGDAKEKASRVAVAWCPGVWPQQAAYRIRKEKTPSSVYAIRLSGKPDSAFWSAVPADAVLLLDGVRSGGAETPDRPWLARRGVGAVRVRMVPGSEVRIEAYQGGAWRAASALAGGSPAANSSLALAGDLP